MSNFSSFLFAEPSFLEGMGRILDFGGTMTEYNRSPTGELADRYAIAADVRAIAQDFHSAINQLKQEVGSVQGIAKKKAG